MLKRSGFRDNIDNRKNQLTVEKDDKNYDTQ